MTDPTEKRGWHSESIESERRADHLPEKAPTVLPEAMHASAPSGYRCADCTMDKEACPACYTAWWFTRHPNTRFIR